MQKRYDTKIEHYKTKIHEYKEKLDEKQKELEEVISKSDQEHTMYQQEIELLESRLEEERGLHQQKLIRIEEEEYQRLVYLTFYVLFTFIRMRVVCNMNHRSRN